MDAISNYCPTPNYTVQEREQEHTHTSSSHKLHTQAYKSSMSDDDSGLINTLQKVMRDEKKKAEKARKNAEAALLLVTNDRLDRLEASRLHYEEKAKEAEKKGAAGSGGAAGGGGEDGGVGGGDGGAGGGVGAGMHPVSSIARIAATIP